MSNDKVSVRCWWYWAIWRWLRWQTMPSNATRSPSHELQHSTLHSPIRTHQSNPGIKVHTKINLLIDHQTSVACAVGPGVNPLQNRETQHVNIVLQCMYVSIFWTAKYERKSCLNWMVSFQVLPRSLPSKT
jgi:hypothetical protein